MRNGDYLKGRSTASKCDPNNTHWGARDQWYIYDDTSPLNFAYRWQQWEHAYPCDTQQRADWPAFSPTGDHVPFTPSAADGALKQVLLAVLGSASVCALLTWHSFRVTLARWIVAANPAADSDAIAQAILRWKTPESVHLYAQLTHHAFSDQYR